MLPKFNIQKLFEHAFRRTADKKNARNCFQLGHFVDPSTTQKKKRDGNFRFLAPCMFCQKQLMVELVVNKQTGVIKTYVKEYNQWEDMRGYFGDINRHGYGSLEEMREHEMPSDEDSKVRLLRRPTVFCSVCNEGASDIAAMKLCRDHMLKILLNLAMVENVSADNLIEKMRNEQFENKPRNMLAEAKMYLLVDTIVATLPREYIVDFIQWLPNLAKRNIMR